MKTIILGLVGVAVISGGIYWVTGNDSAMMKNDVIDNSPSSAQDNFSAEGLVDADAVMEAVDHTDDNPIDPIADTLMEQK